MRQAFRFIQSVLTSFGNRKAKGDLVVNNNYYITNVNCAAEECSCHPPEDAEQPVPEPNGG